MAEEHVWIRFEPDRHGGMFVCGDKDGEYARATHWPMFLPYVEELVFAAGTIREHGLVPPDRAPHAAIRVHQLPRPVRAVERLAERLEGTEPLTDDEIRLCLEGLSLRAYRMSPVGLIDSARAKLRARLARADG